MSVKDAAQAASVPETTDPWDTQHKPSDPRMLKSIGTFSRAVEQHIGSTVRQHQPLDTAVTSSVSSWHSGLVRSAGHLHLGLPQGSDV